MYANLKEFLVVLLLYIVQTLSSPITDHSSSAILQTQTNQSESSTLSCISRDRRWSNPCGVARVFRRSVNSDLRTKLEGIQYFINDTIKHYIAGEYFHSHWMTTVLEAHPQDVFSRFDNRIPDEEDLKRSMYAFVANIDVLSNCGTGALNDRHLLTLLDELNSRSYSALCNIDMTSGNRSDVIYSADSMVEQKVKQFITTQNGLSQAFNIYVVVNDIERVLRAIKNDTL